MGTILIVATLLAGAIALGCLFGELIFRSIIGG